MRPDAYKSLSRFRVKTGPLASHDSLGNNGAFVIPFTFDSQGRPEVASPSHYRFSVIVSDQGGWDHVSVHISIIRSTRSGTLEERTPTWQEMCLIKDLFFGPEETVIQIHPPRSRYVNNHEHVLHLWRPYNRSIPMPPMFMV